MSGDVPAILTSLVLSEKQLDELSFLANLDGTSVADQIRTAVEAYTPAWIQALRDLKERNPDTDFTNLSDEDREWLKHRADELMNA